MRTGITNLLKLESTLLFIALTALYFILDLGFWPFVILFFAPDLTFVFYLFRPKVDAWAHNYGVAVMIAVVGLVYTFPFPWFGVGGLTSVGLVMAAHIAFDRMLGCGLKYESGFKDTHLGTIGRRNAGHSPGFPLNHPRFRKNRTTDVFALTAHVVIRWLAALLCCDNDRT